MASSPHELSDAAPHATTAAEQVAGQRATPDQVRALVPAMAGLVILLLALVVVVWLGGRIVRRSLRKPLLPSGGSEHDWYVKPLALHEGPPPSDEPI